MKDGNEIEIWYRWNELDKTHEYSVVCRERHEYSYNVNGWIYWIWYKLGEQLTKKEKKSFRLYPFAMTWDEK